MAIPSSKGWETADWQAWFELLLSKAIGRLRDLKKGKGDPAKHVHESRKMLKRLLIQVKIQIVRKMIGSRLHLIKTLDILV